MANPYKTLGVSSQASQEEIRSAFRRLARIYHPDVNPSPTANEEFLRVTEAYQILSDRRLRSLYDRGLLIDREESKRRKIREHMLEQRVDEIVRELLRQDHEEIHARQVAVTTSVSLFVSTFIAALVRPPIFESASVIGWLIWLTLFGLGIGELVKNVTFLLKYYTFDDESTISLMQPYEELQKPFTRVEAWTFLIGGFCASLVLGLLVRYLLAFSRLPGDRNPFLRLLLGDGDLILCLLLLPPMFVFLVARVRQLGIFENREISILK